ncbi:TIGR03758 family integrating conjugative element protein [Vibrio sinensis]|uniref:TIGR03758 family integrating conjugative element protein n=1 Tax=Vibrio sinensis TaxID=2302434 RepID=A0A3A6Q9W6_9VIBR|nr:TIGR03758 family integrating conjugative element protein [Vibrio sinensis]RJX68667.1 TIGR03758 family integrating conjugative element protein [Vibrio sinensis]
MSVEIDPGRSLDAFTHGAGYTPNSLAMVLGSVAFVGLLAWVIWTAWSGFKGMRNSKVTKEVFRRMIFRALFIFLILQFFLFYGITS